MKARYYLFFSVLLAGTAFSGSAGTVADLDPELKEALLRDDACMKNTVGSAISSMGSPVSVQELLTGGHEAGVVAAPQDSCHCRGRNCLTYVYLKASDDYKLALQGSFASLKPMKVVKNGLPSLSGKVQVSDAAEETTVYDWTGREYQASLCATVSMGKNQRLPKITRHPCKTGAARGVLE